MNSIKALMMDCLELYYCFVIKKMSSTRQLGYKCHWKYGGRATGFDLTFQKSYLSFHKKYNHKTDLKCCQSWLGDKENNLLWIA